VNSKAGRLAGQSVVPASGHAAPGHRPLQLRIDVSVLWVLCAL